MEHTHNMIMGLLLAGVIIGGYFLPTIVAYRRGHHNRGTIFVTNLAFGWTFIGWFVALGMATSGIRKDVA